MEADHIILVRHGQTNFNKSGICQGQLLDGNLNTMGKIQAHGFARLVKEALRHDVKNAGIKIYSSPMQRAFQTAHIVVQECGSSSIQSNGIILDDRLKEGNMGIAQGFRPEEWPMEMPSEFTWRDIDKLNNSFPNGESYMDIFQRTKEFIDSVPEGPVVIVTHEMVSKCIRGYHCPDTSLEQMCHLSHPQDTIYLINRQTGAVSERTISI